MTGTATREDSRSSRGIHRVMSYVQCPRLFGYVYLLHLVPVVVKKALALGTLVHVGVEALYTNRSYYNAIMNCSEAYAPMSYDALKIVEAYAKRYPVAANPASGEVTEEMGRVAFVEKEFGLMVCGEEPMTRRLDLGLLTPQNKLIVLDTKTAGRMQERKKKTSMDYALFTQEMIGRWVATKEMGVEWGGFYLNLVSTGRVGEFERYPLKWSSSFLSEAEESLLFWLRGERHLVEKYNDGQIDPWKLPKSYQCYPNGYACDYWRLCHEGKTALNGFKVEEQ